MRIPCVAQAVGSALGGRAFDFASFRMIFMPDSSQSPALSRDERLADVLDEYLRMRRSGTAPSHAELIAAHADLASELRECLPSVDFLDASDERPDPELIESLAEFEIIETIGRGGMGIVYRARQKSLDRDCLLYTSPSPRDLSTSRMPSSA